MKSGWEEIRKEYQSRMELASEIIEKSVSLTNRVPEIDIISLRAKILAIREQITKEHHRLKENRFNVAIIGLEKAGKSLLLNAWLGEDILPSREERCTYTSTEIWSAPTVEEQRYEVEYFTKEEFRTQLDQRKADLNRLTGRDRKDLEKEITEIERLLPEIERFTGRSQFERKFSDVREIREELKPIIALDPAQARAVKRIRVYTLKLKEARNIVFHDVPGFNSPFELHKQQTHSKLSECDAIIYAKLYDMPDLVDNEISMLKIADENDPYVSVADKIFIALTKIDKAEDKEKAEELLATAKKKWKNETGLQASRILPVASLPHLCNKGTASYEYMKRKDIYLDALKKLGISDGINELKAVMDNYIDNERSNIVSGRYERLFSDFNALIKDLLKSLTAKFPETLKGFEIKEEEKKRTLFTAKWKQLWAQIERDFTDYYLKEFFSKDEPDDKVSLNPIFVNFQEKYNALVDDYSAQLPINEENLKASFKRKGLSDSGDVLRTKGHSLIREDLKEQAIKDLEKLSESLTGVVINAKRKVADYCQQLLFNIKDVHDIILGDDTEAQQIKVSTGLQTLFLRFTRPAVRVFLETPRHGTDRTTIIESCRQDIKMLDLFYKGDKTKKNIEDFLQYGKWIIEIGEMAGTVPGGTSKIVDMTMQDIEFDPFGKGNEKVANDWKAILNEIKDDADALNNYLKNSVFHAAGFTSYFQQELDRVKDSFLYQENQLGTWQVRVQSALETNPAVKKEFGNIESDYEFRRSIINDITEVNLKFKEFLESVSIAK